LLLSSLALRPWIGIRIRTLFLLLSAAGRGRRQDGWGRGEEGGEGITDGGDMNGAGGGWVVASVGVIVGGATGRGQQRDGWGRAVVVGSAGRGPRTLARWMGSCHRRKPRDSRIERGGSGAGRGSRTERDGRTKPVDAYSEDIRNSRDSFSFFRFYLLYDICL
jgi:hypothetical protein